jgi:predicted TIM-barrel fold metal-dependent hydrolase
MIVHGVFTRHPKLKAVSIENGSYFVYRLIKRLKKAANNHRRHFAVDPVEQLRTNVWIAPYYEDDLADLATLIGVDKILFGSDWPHGEGLQTPIDYIAELTAFSEADVRKIMRDNALGLLGISVSSAS